jgi:signal peptidase I
MVFAWWKKNWIWIVPTTVIFSNFITIIPVKGRSMSPLLNPNDDKERDIVLVFKTNNVNINDICILKHPMDMNLSLIKRIRGLPGDWAYFQNRGQTVPEGFVWVQSEEPYRAIDSREFGPIPRGLIVGKALAVIWPLGHIKWL